jgi:aminoglycoside phosphotransferase (APT) family kinase protein
MREIHTIAVDGAGARGPNTWEFRDWHTLVEVQAHRDSVEINRFEDAQASKAFYLAIVDEFVRLARLQPNQSFLLHGDLGLENIVVDNNRVVGLIDAGWRVSGNPLMDVSYVMNSRLGVGEGMRGLLEGYGVPGLDEHHDVLILRLYQWLGKLIHFSSTGQRERYEQRRQLLFEFASRHGFWSGPTGSVT